MDGGKAHDTGLGCRVNLRALEVGRIELLARSNDGADLGMTRGIVRLQNLIVPRGDDLSLANDTSSEWAAISLLDPSIGFFESDDHETFISTWHDALV